MFFNYTNNTVVPHISNATGNTPEQDHSLTLGLSLASITLSMCSLTLFCLTARRERLARKARERHLEDMRLNNGQFSNHSLTPV